MGSRPRATAAGEGVTTAQGRGNIQQHRSSGPPRRPTPQLSSRPPCGGRECRPSPLRRPWRRRLFRCQVSAVQEAFRDGSEASVGCALRRE
jgi:hypothetical protein